MLDSFGGPVLYKTACANERSVKESIPMLMNSTFKLHNAERRAKAVVYTAMCTLGVMSSMSNPFDGRRGQQPASIEDRRNRH